MSESELKKRIRKINNDYTERRFAELEVNLLFPNDVFEILDEAKADFPQQEMIGTIVSDEEEYNQYGYNPEKVNAWFKKWFGGVEEK